MMSQTDAERRNAPFFVPFVTAAVLLLCSLSAWADPRCDYMHDYDRPSGPGEHEDHISFDLAGDVLFGFDEDELAQAAQEALREVAQALRQEDEIHEVLIEGHTDSRGSHAYNVRLSERRAEAVKHWLLRERVLSSDQVEIRGLGSQRPRRPEVTQTGEDDPEGRACNRRVEIYVATQAEVDLSAIADRRGRRPPELTWRISGDRSRFDVGEVIEFEAEYEQPMGLDRERLPKLSVHVGDKERMLEPSAEIETGERVLVGTASLTKTRAGVFPVRIQAEDRGHETQGEPGEVEVMWPDSLQLSLEPQWMQCDRCVPDENLILFETMAEDEDVILLPLVLRALSETAIGVDLIAKELPSGVVVVDGSGDRLLEDTDDQARWAIDESDTINLAIAVRPHDPSPETTPVPIELAARHGDSGVSVSSQFAIAPYYQLSLRPLEDWTFDLATGQMEKLVVEARVNGAAGALRAPELKVDGLPLWAGRPQQSEDDPLRWTIKQSKPWWLSPAFVPWGDRDLVLELRAAGMNGEAIVEEHVLSVGSSQPWWHLFGVWLAKLFLFILLLIWVIGILRKPRFDPAARVRYRNPAIRLDQTKTLRRNPVTRYIVPFVSEKATVHGLEWTATRNPYVFLTVGQHSSVEINEVPRQPDGRGRVIVHPNDRLQLDEGGALYIYEVSS